MNRYKVLITFEAANDTAALEVAEQIMMGQQEPAKISVYKEDFETKPTQQPFKYFFGSNDFVGNLPTSAG